MTTAALTAPPPEPNPGRSLLKSRSLFVLQLTKLLFAGGQEAEHKGTRKVRLAGEKKEETYIENMKDSAFVDAE